MKDVIYNLFLVFLGGGLGATSRHGLALLFGHLATWTNYPIDGPWPVLVANLVGSFLIGIASSWFLIAQPSSEPIVRLLLVTGFLGGFTTFSSFMIELVALAKDPPFYSTIAYLLIHIVGGILIALAGLKVGDLIWG